MILIHIVADELKNIDKKNNTKYLEAFKEDINQYDNLRTVLINWNDYINIWKEEGREENFYFLKEKINYCLLVLNCGIK